MKRRAFWAILLLCSTGLFAYVLYRAIHLSFVHDESLSYTIVIGMPNWKGSANHHPLNTRLMRWSAGKFGYGEWSLRLPNVASFLLYLSAGLLLLRRLKSVWTICLGFAMLNLNPFLLDYFGLARGYGLASALSLTAIFFFVEACYRSGTIWFECCLFISFVFSALADLGSYAWVNLHLSLLAAALIVLFCDSNSLRLRFNRRSIIFAVILFFANGWFLLNLSKRILILQNNGQLYGGAKQISETLTSLIQTYLYTNSSPASVTYIIWPLLGVLLMIGFWLIFRLVKDRRLDVPEILYAVFLLAVLVPLSEHYLLGSLYPVDRSALYYLPLIALPLTFALDKLNRTIIQIGSVLCALLMVYHFSDTANLRYTLIWKYDANTRDAMEEVVKRFAGSGKSIHIGNTWLLEPGINYYRLSRQLDWLAPATRDGVASSPDYDVLLSFPSELTAQRDHYSVIREFPDSGLELMFRNP